MPAPEFSKRLFGTALFPGVFPGRIPRAFLLDQLARGRSVRPDTTVVVAADPIRMSRNQTRFFPGSGV